MKSFGRRKNSTLGFSLIEVVLALGVFSFTVLILIGLLPSLLNSINKLNVLNQLTGISARIDAYLQNHKYAFDAVYNWVENGKSKTLLAYSYTADPSQVRGSGDTNTPDPRSDFLVDMIRLMGTDEFNYALIKEELNAVEGPVFKIKIRDSKTYSEFEEGRDEQGNLVPLIQYPEAVVALEIRIYFYSPHSSQFDFIFDENLFHEENNICVYTYAINR